MALLQHPLHLTIFSHGHFKRVIRNQNSKQNTVSGATQGGDLKASYLPLEIATESNYLFTIKVDAWFTVFTPESGHSNDPLTSVLNSREREETRKWHLIQELEILNTDDKHIIIEHVGKLAR